MLRASRVMAGLIHRPVWCKIGTETNILKRMQTAILEFIDLVTGPSYLTLKERLAYATTMVVTMANAGTWSWLKWMGEHPTEVSNVKVIVSGLLVFAAFALNVWVAANNRRHKRIEQEIALAEEERAKAEEKRAEEIHRLEVEARKIANDQARINSTQPTEQDPE